ncbi:MAG: TonB-dependent siderophore receptor [Pseudomonadales bacterium]|nr:TonB-dependent siderophore receptor [Pseudomonadales bacterium]
MAAIKVISEVSRRTIGISVFAVAVVLGANSFAYAASPDEPIEEIVVVAEVIGELGLDRPSDAGSRLGLSLLETPATVEIIDGDTMRARGYKQVSDAVKSLPGVVSGESPAAPSTFSMRGFTRSQITILRDGLWVGPANMVMRPQNIFNLDRIEVLRGPNSVLHGQGAVAGTINTVNKSAEIGEPQRMDFLASYGRYDTYQLGAGAGGSLSDSAWYRADVSQRESDGYVDRMDSSSLNATASLLWQATDTLSLKLSADYLDDDLADYWGTPLVPTTSASRPMNNIISTRTGETLDEATRFRNYNVSDSRAESDQLFVRADVEWSPSENLRFKNTLYQFDADREWLNAEGYIYCTQIVDVCTQTGEIQRYYGYFFVFHDQDLLGNRFTAQYDFDIAGMENRLLGGFEVTNLDFERSRGFRISEPLSPGDSVDPFSPIPGLYGPEELRGVSPTDIETRALFLEEMLKVNDQFSLIAALRYEEMELDRENFNGSGMRESSGFNRDFDWMSWRIGAVVNVAENLVAYAQYSDAKDPVNANIFLVNAGEDFDLTDAEQWEIGIKAILMQGKAEATIAYFDIERDDVLERIGVDSAANVGGRESHGIEISGTVAATDQLKLGVNAAYTDAEFSRSANFVSFAGNTPPNVPEWTANLWASYDIADLPIEIGASFRFVDDRFGDNANNVTLKSYFLADVFAAWTHNSVRVSARVNNVADEEYVSWSDVFYLGQTDPGFLYANQVLIGSPRTYELSIDVSL